MKAEEKELVKLKIVKKLKRLESDMAWLEEATQPIAPENSIGRVSRMDAINNKSVNEAALRTARERKMKLDNALANLDSPDFGNCSRCGEAIQVKRMLLMPESDRCIKCAGRI